MLAITLTIYRPLLLSSVNAEMASARGIPVRLVGVLYLLALALAAALAAITIGTILSTALLVGPAASALRITRRPLTALLTAARHRHRRDLARHHPRLRQLLLAAARHHLARELLRRDARVHHLPAIRAPRGQTPPTSRPETLCVPGGAAGDTELAAHTMFSGFMVNAWEVASIVAVVAGIVGFFTVMRGSAFAAHAIPNGSFAGAAGADPDRRQHAPRPRRLLARRRYDDRPARPQRTPRRRDRPDARSDARPRRAVLELQRRVRAEVYSLLFGEVLGISPNEIAPDRDPRRALHPRCRHPLPAADALLAPARGGGGTRHQQLPHGDAASSPSSPWQRR